MMSVILTNQNVLLKKKESNQTMRSKLFQFTAILLILGCLPTLTIVAQNSQEQQESPRPVLANAPATTETHEIPKTKQMVDHGGEQTDPEIPMDPRVRMGKLDNGLVYYIQKNEKPEDRAELRLAVGVGSINEDDDQLGLAHFVEHMAFNGTTHFKKSELVDYLQSVGTRFGPDLNAYTSFDETVYMLQVRTDSQALFDKGMLILEDWAQGVAFEDEEIDKERGVVESELRSGLSAEERMRNEYLPVIFHESKYADRLPIGTREIINNAPYEAFKRYYRDWYRPNLMAVVVVGDIDVDDVEADIKQRFAKLTNPEEPRQRETYGFPDHEETLIVITSDKEATFTTARVMYKHQHKKVKNLDDYRRSLVQNVYNRMLNNRLDELRQAADPPFLYGYSGYGRQVGNLDSYTSYVSTGEGEVMKGLRAVLEENKRALEHGFTESELQRTVLEMISEAETSAKEEDKTQSGSLAMRYVYHYLNENPVPSPTQRFELYQKLLPTIQLQEINDLANQWITDGSNRVIVITGPKKEEVPLPTKDEVLSLIEEVDKTPVDPYEDTVTDQPLIADLPPPGSIAAANIMDKIGVTEWTLSNGVRVILKPSDFQNDEIIFTAFSPGGHSLYPDEDYWSAALASAIVNQSGVADFNSIQLEKVLAGKQVRANPYISDLEEGMQGFSTIKDLETMFQLIHLYFTSPRKDSEAYQSLMTRQKQILQNLMVNPNYYFREQLNKIKYNDHLRKGIPKAEELDQVDLDKVFTVYEDRFADASDFTFIFVGNFTEESIKPLVEQYLATLPATDREESWQDVNADVAEGKIVERFSFGEAPKAQVDMSWSGEMDWDDRSNRFEHNVLLEILKNRLRESMREDQGGVYGVRVSGGVSKQPKEGYSVSFSFNAEPDQVDTLINVALTEVESMVKEGPTEEDLQKVLEVLRQSRIKNLKENNYWSSALKRHYWFGLDPEMILLDHYDELLSSVDSEAIHEMAKEVFSTKNYIQLVMMPEEEKE